MFKTTTLQISNEYSLIHTSIHSFIHSVVCFTTYTLPKRVLSRVRSSTFSFNFQNPHFPLRSFCSCLRLLPHDSVNSILPSVFPSVTCFKGRCWKDVVNPARLLSCHFMRYIPVNFDPT